MRLFAFILLILASCIVIPDDPDPGEPPAEPDLPEPWRSSDVGSPQTEGKASYDDGFVIESAGTDIWHSPDEFHFVYQEHEGNFALLARIDTFEAAGHSAKAGVMIRESLSANSRYAYMRLNPPERARGMFQYRIEEGASTEGASAIDASVPSWVRIIRHDDEIIGYISSDGDTWIEAGRVDLDLPDRLLAGLAMTANHQERGRAVFAEAHFDDVEMPPPSRPVLTRSDSTFYLDDDEITRFGVRAANVLQSDEIMERFIENIDDMLEHGIQSFTLTIQGGRYTEGGNSAFNGYTADGTLRPEYAERLRTLLDITEEKRMVPVVKFFYRGRDQEFANEEAVRAAVTNTMEFLKPWRHLWVSVMNEPDHPGYDYPILTTQSGQRETYTLAKSVDPDRIVYVSHVNGANDGFIADTWGRQEGLSPPREGDVSVEYRYRGSDPYDTPGIFTESYRDQTIEDIKATFNAGGYWFSMSRWQQRADSPEWPRYDRGGYGTADDPGVGFMWDTMKELTFS